MDTVSVDKTHPGRSPASKSPVVPDGVDPEEWLRRALAISPEDAEQVREQAAKDVQGDEDPQA